MRRKSGIIIMGSFYLVASIFCQTADKFGFDNSNISCVLVSVTYVKFHSYISAPAVNPFSAHMRAINLVTVEFAVAL